MMGERTVETGRRRRERVRYQQVNLGEGEPLPQRPSGRTQVVDVAERACLRELDRESAKQTILYATICSVV
jgi:hypothetical protein